MFIATSLGGNPARAMVDSGSMLNIVSEDFARKHGLSLVRLPSSSSSFKIGLADGNASVITHGVVATLMVKCGNSVRAAKMFFFVTSLSYDVLLGMPWLTQWSVAIDFATRSIGFRRMVRINGTSARVPGAHMPPVASKRGADRKDRTRKARSSGSSLARQMAGLGVSTQRR